MDEAARTALARRRRGLAGGERGQKIAHRGHAAGVRQAVDVRVSRQGRKTVQMREEDVVLRRDEMRGHRHGRGRRGTVVAERRLVGDTIAVTGEQEIGRGPVQDRRPRHVHREARCRPLAIPREETELIADSTPEPSDMAAVPDGAERRQVARDQFLHLVRREDRAAFEHDARGAPGVAVRERDRDGGSRMATEERDALETERVERPGHGIGVVGDLRPMQGQRVGAAVARSVERDHGKAVGQRLDHREERGRRARRFVKQKNRRTAPGPPHHDLARAAGREAVLDRAGHALFSRRTRLRILPAGLRGRASMKATSFGTLKAARLFLPKAIASSGESVAPARGTTKALTLSPQ